MVVHDDFHSFTTNLLPIMQVLLLQLVVLMCKADPISIQWSMPLPQAVTHHAWTEGHRVSFENIMQGRAW